MLIFIHPLVFLDQHTVCLLTHTISLHQDDVYGQSGHTSAFIVLVSSQSFHGDIEIHIRLRK